MSKAKVLDYEIWPIDKLRANDWNPNSMTPKVYELTKLSILEEGFSDPVDIDPTGLILDGEHRWRVAKDLGMTEIPVFVKERYDDDAKITTIRKDRTHGTPDLIKLSEIVGTLVEELGQQEVERRLGFDESEQQALLEVTNWDWASYSSEDQDAIQDEHKETVSWSVGVDQDTMTRLQKLFPQFATAANEERYGQDDIGKFVALLHEAAKLANLSIKDVDEFEVVAHEE